MNYDISNFPLDIVLNILGIVIIFLLVRLLAYKPVKKFLDARRARLDKEKEDSAKTVAEAEAMRDKYAAVLADAEKNAEAEAKRIIDAANERAGIIISEANERADKVLSLAETKILSEREAALGNIEKESVTMALDIAEKILERRVTDSDTINMAHKFFRELSSK